MLAEACSAVSGRLRLWLRRMGRQLAALLFRTSAGEVLAIGRQDDGLDCNKGRVLCNSMQGQF